MLPCTGTKGKTGRAGRGLLPSLATSSYNTPIIFDKLELNGAVCFCVGALGIVCVANVLYELVFAGRGFCDWLM